MASSELNKFLNAHRVQSKTTYTHTGIGPFAGKYCIPEEKYDQLLKLMADSVLVKLTPVSITERIPKSGIKPLVVDIDFRYPQDCNQSRQHNVKHIEQIVKLYCQAARKILDVQDKMVIKAMVFERNGPYIARGNSKDGIHIIFPDLVCTTQIQKLIRKEVLKTFEKFVVQNEAIGVLPVKNAPADIVDLAVIAINPWQIHPYSSKPGLGRYKLSYNIDNIYDEYEKDFQLKHCDLITDEMEVAKMVGTQHKESKEIKLNPNQKTVFDKLIVKDVKRETQKKQRDVREFITKKRRPKKKLSNEEVSQNIKQAQQLVNKCLAQWRADDYKSWIDVGMCLYNISPTGLLDTWIDFSKKSAKYKDGECEDLWGAFQDGDWTIGSLHYWAKLDNPEVYRELRSSFLSEVIFRSITGTTQDCAEVVYQMFKHEYVCVSDKGQMWYHFRNHRWHEDKSGISLKQRIGNEVLNEYLQLTTFYNTAAIESDDSARDTALFRSKELVNVTYKLRDLPFKEKIMKECVMRFYDKDFLPKLDADPNLMGFENGVYDFKEKQFRDGRASDYVSYSTHIDFPDQEYDEDDEIVQEILEFFAQVFPEPELKDYALTLFSSFLQGSNPDEKFHVFTGTGGNGKSKLIELFMMAVGDYATTIPIALLTQKRASSGSANPELARTRGRRFCVFQEPGENERLNVGIMKEMTGGDKIQARELYCPVFEFKPQFKLCLCCNHKPKIPSDDEGTWRRMSVLEFISRFVKDPNPKNKYEFPRDSHLTQKLNRWKEMFLMVLVHYYNNKYSVEGLNEPHMVKNATLEYQKDSDTYAQFRDEKFVRNEYGSVKVTEAYAIFKQWFSNNMSSKPPTNREFKINMTRKFGSSYTNGVGWKGWSLAINEDEDDGGSVSFTTNQLGSAIKTSRSALKVKLPNIQQTQPDENVYNEVNTQIEKLSASLRNNGATDDIQAQLSAMAAKVKAMSAQSGAQSNQGKIKIKLSANSAVKQPRRQRELAPGSAVKH